MSDLATDRLYDRWYDDSEFSKSYEDETEFFDLDDAEVIELEDGTEYYLVEKKATQLSFDGMNTRKQKVGNAVHGAKQKARSAGSAAASGARSAGAGAKRTAWRGVGGAISASDAAGSGVRSAGRGIASGARAAGGAASRTAWRGVGAGISAGEHVGRNKGAYGAGAALAGGALAYRAGKKRRDEND